ncbi:MAG: AP endonuclease [Actinobacteria bacterium RBG_19FT_COMBO_36_27]|nr:MAG: AP endonuclease [Actinobacteria bacterium RBG_19FT_COMBO_36_27]
MKLGFVSAILADQSFEEIFDFASQNNFNCIEVLCWPKGKAERKYAGVTHIDVDTLDDKTISHIQDYVKKTNVEISALGYYPNPLDPDGGKREFYAEHIKKVINSANKLGLGLVNTFIGKDKSRNIEDNFKLFKEIWPPIIKYAEEKSIKIGIENCPMYFTKDEWPGGNNLASTPAIWRRMFEEIPSKNFGLNYDPSHLLWMQIDYIRPIYEFKDKLFHIHIKDAKVLKHKLSEVGIMATPLELHAPKLPGLGDIDWCSFFAALSDIDYKNCACIEVEDDAFQNTLEDRKNSIILSRKYLKQFYK